MKPLLSNSRVLVVASASAQGAQCGHLALDMAACDLTRFVRSSNLAVELLNGVGFLSSPDSGTVSVEAPDLQVVLVQEGAPTGAVKEIIAKNSAGCVSEADFKNTVKCGIHRKATSHPHIVYHASGRIWLEYPMNEAKICSSDLAPVLMSVLQSLEDEYES